MKPEQVEEIEVLESIYEGDSNYSAINATTYQYKYENECINRSFLVEIIWGQNYPDEAPKINLEVFYNKHLLPTVKKSIINGLVEQCEANLGMSMTFTLFEWMKEAKEVFLEKQPETASANLDSEDQIVSSVNKMDLEDDDDNIKKKKEHLTKAQKRRMWDRQNAAGEKDRGWNWVDIVRHLSQGGKNQESNKE